MPGIKDILTKVIGGIARTNLYSVSIPNKLGDLDFNAKGSQLPSSELGTIEIPYHGRKLKIPGQRTFAEWTVTIMEESNMTVRKAIEAWIDSIDNAETGVMGSGAAMFADIKVSLLNTNGASVMVYTLYGAYPSNMASVDLSYDEQTAPLEYQITFNYSYHTVIGGSQVQQGAPGGGGGAGGIVNGLGQFALNNPNLLIS